MLSQLTDGDPLGFLLGTGHSEGRGGGQPAGAARRARRPALELIRNDGAPGNPRRHRRGEESFRVDALFREAAKIDTVDELKALATDKVGFFVSRLVGRTLDSSTNLKAAFDELKRCSTKIDAFTADLFKAFKEATNSSYATRCTPSTAAPASATPSSTC